MFSRKQVGHAKLHVWDAKGSYEYAVRVTNLPTADQVVRKLSRLLGSEFSITIADDNTIFVDGVVETEAEKARVEKIIDAHGDEGPRVVSLVSLRQQQMSAARTHVKAFKNLLPSQLHCTILDPKTIVIDGEVETNQQKQRVRKILNAVKNVEILQFVRCADDVLSAQQQRIQSLKKAIGKQYQYQTLEDDLLVVRGQAPTQQQVKQIDKIINTVANDLTVVNLVVAKNADAPTAERYVEMLRPVVGSQYTLSTLGKDILIIEGIAKTDAERKRIENILAPVEKDIQVANLVTKPGLTADLSPAEEYKKVLKPVINDNLQLHALAEDILLVEGQLPTATEKQRTEKILAPIGKKITLLKSLFVGEDSRAVAQRTASMLREVVDKSLTVKAADDNLVIIEGQVASDEKKQQIGAVAEQLADRADVVNMVTVKTTPSAAEKAEVYQNALQNTFGDEITCRPLDAKTIAVEGKLDTQKQKTALSETIKKLSDDFTMVNLVTIDAKAKKAVSAKAQKKAAAIEKSLGEDYDVRPTADNKFVIEGTASDRQQMQHVQQVIDELDQQAKVVNRVKMRKTAEIQSSAKKIVSRLKTLVADRLNVVAIDDSTVLIQGVVEQQKHKNTAQKLAKKLSRPDGMKVIPLVLTTTEAQKSAPNRIKYLKSVLGEQYEYTAWPKDTILVEGVAEGWQQLQRVEKIIETAADDIGAVSLVTLPEGEQKIKIGRETRSLVERISAVIDDRYRVWALKPHRIIVEGVAADNAAIERLNTLLEAFGDDAQITNLVRVAPEPTVPLLAKAETLRSVLGSNYQVRTIQGKAIVVEAVVTDKKDAKRAKTVIDGLKGDTNVINLVTVADPKKRQVVAHAKILDLDRGAMKDIGVDWGQITSGGGFQDQPILVKVQEGVDIVNKLATNVRALAQKDRARILAEPNLVVNEGETAEMTVGGEIPVPVPQMGTGTTSVTIDYKQYGVVLKLTPKILDDGNTIQLQIEPEVSSVDPSTQVSISGMSVPGFKTRRAKTQVDVPDGGALMIGGLLRHDQSKIVRKIPVLGELPIIGELFTSEEWQSGSSELVILVMPEILHAGG